MGDLLGAEDGARFEIFARGRDRGIDLRRTHADGTLEIVQVKHYGRSSFSSLKTAAAKEKFKLEALDEKPSVYRFVTSQHLTVHQKDELLGELRPYTTDAAQIVGADELELLLRRHPGVERQHPKLWLTGSTQLIDMVHADVRDRSAALISDIEDAMPAYVRHSRFAEAQERLHEGRVLIIAGDPGVGKTTLARMLVADALASGYDEPIAVARHTDEIRRVLDPSRKQVIFYDDFLGRTALERLDKNSDRELTAMMRQVLRAEHTLFILTTREYILRHAAQLHEELRDGGVEERRYLLELDHYRLLDRGRIFLNHAYLSTALEPPAARALVRDRAYLRILEHASYNPRTIAYITGLAGPGFQLDRPEDYVEFALSVLDDPARLWRQAFRREIGDAERALLLAKVSTPSEVTEGDLRRLYDTAAPMIGAEAGQEAFEDALNALDDSMLRTYQDAGQVFVAVRDASIEDYLRDHVAGHPGHARALLESAQAFEQVQWLVRRADADRLLGDPDTLAAAVKRTFAATSVTWRSVYWADDPKPDSMREDINLPRRLRTVHGFMQRSPELEPLLRPWWEEQLAQLLRNLGRAHENQRSDLVGLVGTVRGWIAQIDGAAQLLARYMSEGLDFDTRWSELLKLRELWPELFDDERWSQLQASCERWMVSALTDVSDLRDVEEVDEIAAVAERMGVRVDDPLVAEARDEVQELRGSRDDREYEPPGAPARVTEATDDERAQVHEAFVRLADDAELERTHGDGAGSVGGPDDQTST